VIDAPHMKHLDMDAISGSPMLRVWRFAGKRWYKRAA